MLRQPHVEPVGDLRGLFAPERRQFAPQVWRALLGVGVTPQDQFHASSFKSGDFDESSHEGLDTRQLCDIEIDFAPTLAARRTRPLHDSCDLMTSLNIS
jgi:hypothetical protein